MDLGVISSRVKMLREKSSSNKNEKTWHWPRKDGTMVRDPFESAVDFQLSIKVGFPPVFSEVKRLLPGMLSIKLCV